LPASEACSEADVLSTAADRERLLIFGYFHDSAIFFFGQFNFKNLRRLQRLFHEISGFLAPFDDIDFFSTELGSHNRDAHAALTDECANRVDVIIVGVHRNFCAAAWLAHDALDLDNARSHFWHFGFKQFGEKTWVRARKANECT